MPDKYFQIAGCCIFLKVRQVARGNVKIVFAQNGNAVIAFLSERGSLIAQTFAFKI